MISQVCLNFSLIPPPPHLHHICPPGESPAPVTGSSSGVSTVQPTSCDLVDLTGNTLNKPARENTISSVCQCDYVPLKRSVIVMSGHRLTSRGSQKTVV